MDLIKRSFFSGAGGGPSFFRPLYHKRLSSFEVFSPRRERYKNRSRKRGGKPIDATSARRSRRLLARRGKRVFLGCVRFSTPTSRPSSFFALLLAISSKKLRLHSGFYDEVRTIVGSAHREGGFGFVFLR